MSVQSFEIAESTINQSVPLSNGSNARARRKEEKRADRSGSPYNKSTVINPRQAWVNAMQQGQGFSPNLGSYTKLDNYHTPVKPLPKTKPLNRASHLDKEEMYDEIQRQKELVAAFTKEKSLLKTKIIKLENELNKKDKLLDQTYSQSLSGYGGASERSFATKTETNSTITGLRQKCHKLECLIREKDNEIKSIKSDLKSTRLQELEIMADTYYEEIRRLTDVIEQRSFDLNTTFTPRASTPLLHSEKEKILEGKIRELELNNSVLKKQVVKTSQVKPLGDTGLLSEYASLSRSDLEEQHRTRCKELFDANLANDEMKTKCAVLDEEMVQMKAAKTKQEESSEKMRHTREVLQRKLSSTQGEHEAQRLVIKRLNKTVRTHEEEVGELQKQIDKDRVAYREKLKLKTDKIVGLEGDITKLYGQLEEFSKSDDDTIKSDEPPKIEAGTVEVVESTAPVSDKDTSVTKDEVTVGPASETTPTAVDRAKRKGTRDTQREKKRTERKQRLLEDTAARKIQKNYRNHNLIKSVGLIQRLLRGHTARVQTAKTEHEDSASVIQTALRAYQYRNSQIEKLDKENKQPLAGPPVGTIAEKDSDDEVLNQKTPRHKTLIPKDTYNLRKPRPNTAKDKLRNSAKSSDRNVSDIETLKSASIPRNEEMRPKKVQTKTSRPAVKISDLVDSTDEDDLVMM